MLATGGAGKVYLYTSNPDVATGDGVAMAYRAGADIANMEFFQFHPTCLFHPQAKSFLISEALRGEGGVLRLRDGAAFMERYHPLKPTRAARRRRARDRLRDQAHRRRLRVARHDARTPELPARALPEHPRECLRFGIDMTREPIPVVPAAHYMCGGVRGRRATGAAACPGSARSARSPAPGCTAPTGSRRNSLLEGLVFGQRAALALRARAAPPRRALDPPDWDVGSAAPSDEAVVVSHNWDEMRRCMWNYVGIVRSDKRLERAARRIALLKEEIREYYWKHLVTRDLLELRNIADVAELIVRCARFRKESRGLHYTLDYPETDDERASAATPCSTACASRGCASGAGG